MSNQLFVSYARVDAKFVNHLKSNLKEKFTVWIDSERLRGGDDWRNGIDDAIRNSFALIVVLTPASCESKYVTYEWSYALGLGIPVIPIRLGNKDSETMEVHPRLAPSHYYDFGDPYDEPWESLIERLEEHKQLYLSEGASETAWRFIDLGRNLYKKDDLLNALDAFKEAAKFASPNLQDDIYYEVGKIYMELKKPELAEDNFLKAAQMNSNHIQALVELGALYRKRADQTLSSENPSENETLLIKSMEKYTTALNLKDDLLDQEGESVWGSLGGVYQRLNQYDKAIECYKHAVKVMKTSYPFNNLGLLYLEKDLFDEMRANFELVELFAQQKIRLNPGDAWAHNDLLVALFVNDKMEDAKRTFRNILVLGEKDAMHSLHKTLKRLTEKPSSLSQTIAPQIVPMIDELEKQLAKL